jgi:hypothetical protein
MEDEMENKKLEKNNIEEKQYNIEFWLKIIW